MWAEGTGAAEQNIFMRLEEPTCTGPSQTLRTYTQHGGVGGGGSGAGGDEGSETAWPWPIVTESLPVRRRLHFAAILIALPLLSYLRLDCEAEWLNSGG